MFKFSVSLRATRARDPQGLCNHSTFHQMKPRLYAHQLWIPWHHARCIGEAWLQSSSIQVRLRRTKISVASSYTFEFVHWQLLNLCPATTPFRCVLTSLRAPWWILLSGTSLSMIRVSCSIICPTVCPTATFLFSLHRIYLHYKGDGSIGGWQALKDPNGEGSGTLHRTNGNGASVALPFYGMYYKISDRIDLMGPTGTGFQLTGDSNAFYDIKVDDETPVTGLMVPTNQVLYSRYNLTAGNHNVMLTSRATTATTILTLDKAVIFNSGRNVYVNNCF